MQGNKVKIYHVDAFTRKPFGGNPACVVVLHCMPEDKVLLNIASENGLPETAFLFVPEMKLRWFTPDIEMDLCGHATLASAYVVHNFYSHLMFDNEINFKTCEGKISVKVRNNRYILELPIRKPLPAILPLIISQSLNIQPQEVYLSRDYILVYDNKEDILNLQIDRNTFDKVNLDPGGVCVTAINDNEIVSRFFTPQATILEDPVTGSAHCSLVPLWSEKLGINNFKAFQLSKRGGELDCTLTNNNVLIGGEAVCFSVGELFIRFKL